MYINMQRKTTMVTTLVRAVLVMSWAAVMSGEPVARFHTSETAPPPIS